MVFKFSIALFNFISISFLFILMMIGAPVEFLCALYTREIIPELIGAS